MNNIYLDENNLKYLIDQEAKKLCGKVMKRFEVSVNKEEIKVQVKEVIYEWSRDLRDSIFNIAKKDTKIILTNQEEQK